MQEPNTVPTVLVDGNHYSVDSLCDDAKAVIDVIRENNVLQAHHIAQHRQLNVAAELLNAKLKELLEGVEPLELKSEGAE